MRHRKAGKRLSRNRQERIALQRNLALGLFEQFGEDREFITTSRAKAKWVKPFVEQCITLGVKGYRELQKAADAQGCTIAELRAQHAEGPKEERTKFKAFPPKVRDHLAKSIHFRRQAVKKLRSPEAVRMLFDSIAPRYLDRPGGYLRVLKTGKVNLGDASERALLCFVEGPKVAAAEA